jgi:hypothetical protein
MAIIGGIWSDTAIAGYMGFAAICGGKAEPLPLRRGWNRVRFARRGWISFRATQSGVRQQTTNNYQLILLAILPENDEIMALINLTFQLEQQKI